ncbi:MAG: amidohydrolase family protein [Chloroflexi bacterium]|nr:amidohydrolase family protein [Chloroflexota bacterium]
MTHLSSPLFERMLEQIEAMPVVDCHEHMMGPAGRPEYKEPIAALVHGYVLSDLWSAAFGVTGRDVNRLADPDVSTDDKWPLFERLWHATEHTAYARVTKLLLKSVYGQDTITRETLDRIAERLSAQDEAAYFRTIDQAGIQALLVDVLGWLPKGLGSFLDGSTTFPDKWRPLISLPQMHPTALNWGTITSVGALADMHITSLDEYVEAVSVVFERCIERGVVGIKDQSAYGRSLTYDLVCQADAERLFNRVLVDPRNNLGWPEGKPLSDYLFHAFMRLARDFDLPVQLHTGHMAGIRNRVDKTNAAQLTSVLELHQEVHFDLFHGNWPYLGDLLFLGKNYPNVSLDCCWLHIIDPPYAVELLKRSVYTLPHTKVHGFGGDYGDVPEYVVGHLQIARQNIACALTDLIETGWLNEEQALSLAEDWLFNNPNRFFGLKLERV